MRINTHIKKALSIIVTAVALASCGGGGGGGGSDEAGVSSDQPTNNGSNSNEGKSSISLAHDALSRANGKVLSLSSDESSTSSANKAFQKAFANTQAFQKTVLESGQEIVDCDSGNILVGYEISASEDETQIDFDVGMQYTACRTEDIANDQSSTTDDPTIARISEGMINTSISFTVSPDNPEQITSYNLNTNIDPGTTDTYITGDVSLAVSTNKLDINVGYDGTALKVNGVEDVTIVVESSFDEKISIYDAYTYSDVEYSLADLDNEDLCPIQGSVTGESDGTSFVVEFKNASIEVTNSGQATETFSCNDVITMSDEAVEEDTSEDTANDTAEDTSDDLYNQALDTAAYGSAVQFNYNMMTLWGIPY